MKEMLILSACGMQSGPHECANIKAQAELYQLNVYNECPKTNEELIGLLNRGIKYDYIYLSSHGDQEGFASEDGSINFEWLDFGTALCNAGCLNEDAIIMLSCCRGGLNQVAYDLFYCCNNISYVVGPRQSLYPTELLIGFNILLYNLEQRNIDAVVACEKIKAATDIRFVCFDKLETEAEPAFHLHLKKYNEEDLKDLNEAKVKANEEPVVIPTELTMFQKPHITK